MTQNRLLPVENRILLAANTADCILKHLQFRCEPDQRIAKLGALFNRKELLGWRADSPP